MKRAETIEVLKEFTFDKFGQHYICQIKQGETGEYFAHSDCYTFEGRGGCVPYVDGKVAMRNNIHFKKNNVGEHK